MTLVVIRGAKLEDMEVLIEPYKEFNEFLVKGVRDRLQNPSAMV
jgi:hypothetical protein